MSQTEGETGKARRTALQPARTYEVPGGPYAKNLGEVQVEILAEIERGGEGDRGYGNRR